LMRAILLAGGLGTRLRTVVSDVPKPMAPVGGRPVLEHLFDYWIGQGVTEIVLNIGHKADVISSHFGDQYRGLPVRYAIEDKPLGTGGGLLLSVNDIVGTDPCLILNADSLLALSLAELEEAHRAAGADITLGAFPTSERDRYGALETDSSGHIIRFTAKGQLQEGKESFLASAGVYFGSADAFRALRVGFEVGTPFSLETDGFPWLLAHQINLHAFGSESPFLDIGVPADFARAPAFFESLR
jgi:D-glycero-alpha-D-manno-heptose 1-phosphate guanylyltransferase